jgi:hypothetical protein
LSKLPKKFLARVENSLAYSNELESEKSFIALAVGGQGGRERECERERERERERKREREP